MGYLISPNERKLWEGRMKFYKMQMQFFFGDRIIFPDDPYGLRKERTKYIQRMMYLERTLRW